MRQACITLNPRPDVFERMAQSAHENFIVREKRHINHVWVMAMHAGIQWLKQPWTRLARLVLCVRTLPCPLLASQNSSFRHPIADRTSTRRRR